MAIRSGGGAGSSGGKSRGNRAGRGFESKAGSDVGLQARLVGFDGPQVVATGVHHGSAQIALAEQGIAGDYFPLQGEQPQQAQGRLVFVGLGIDADLSEHRLDVGGVNGDQVLAGDIAVATAFEGLAVHVEESGLGGQTGSDPSAEGLLECLDIQTAQGARQGRFGRSSAPGEAERMSQRRAVVAAQLSDGIQTAASHQQTERDQSEHGRERMTSPASVTGIRDGRENVGKRERRQGKDPPDPPWFTRQTLTSLLNYSQDQRRNSPGPATPQYCSARQ